MFLKYNIIIWYQTKCYITLCYIPNLLLPDSICDEHDCYKFIKIIYKFINSLIYSLLFMEYVWIYYKIETGISASTFESDILGSNIS